MAENVQIPVHQKLQVSRDGKDWYVSSIEYVENDRIYIGIPYQKGHPLILPPGQNIVGKFAGENASYQFNTRVIERLEDQVPLYVLAMPQEIKRIQQRNFVRVPVILPVKYAVLNGKKDEKPEFKKATSVDLSAGGIKLAFKERIKEGTELLLCFDLEMERETVSFELKGTVIRLEVIQIEGDYYIYHAGIKFTDITRPQQDKIMAYLFLLQARQRRLR